MKSVTFSLFLGLSLLSSCLNRPSGEKQSTSEHIQNVQMLYFYKAGPNGMADIHLKVYNNNTFELFFHILEDGTKMTFTGTANETNNNIILIFEDNEMDLNALFDENYDDNKGFEVIDEKEVAINKSVDNVSIWGVSCIRY